MLLVSLLFAATALCQPMKNVCEAPIPANSIADSVGVNIHLHSGDTVYGNYTLIKTLLADLGVLHTRDGLIDTTWQPYYKRHIELGSLGIKCLFITSPRQSSALLTSWPNRVPGAFEGYEEPNEYDASGDHGWAATLSAFVQRLYSAVKSSPATARFPIVGPSLTQPESYPLVASLQRYFDYSNMHNYFGGHNPGTSGWGADGYGSIAYNLKVVQAAWPQKPVWTTETGYLTDTSNSQGIPEAVQGKYVPRMVLEQVLHGVSRTYIYELIDEGKIIAGDSGAYGLARIDGSRKPAFIALKNLMAVLKDPGAREAPDNLQFTLSGGSSDVHHLLMSKRDGSYYLAFWLEEEGYDANKHMETPLKPETLTFATRRSFRTMQIISMHADGSLTRTPLEPASRVVVEANDCVTLLRLQ
jgi:hypothetical protein